MKPTIGRIVHYTPDNIPSNVPRAAIITDVNDQEVHLHVFNPVHEDPPVEVLFNVPFTAEEAGTSEARGHWSWPKRM